MKQLGSEGGSNAAPNTSDNKPEKGDPYKLGYSVTPFPSSGPAESNADVKTTKDNSVFSDQQDGTSIDAYKHQPKTIKAETGE